MRYKGFRIDWHGPALLTGFAAVALFWNGISLTHILIAVGFFLFALLMANASNYHIYRLRQQRRQRVGNFNEELKERRGGVKIESDRGR